MKKICLIMIICANLCKAGNESNHGLDTTSELTAAQKHEGAQLLKELKDEKTQPQAEMKREVAFNEWLARIKPIVVYGLVVDDAGKPVNSAEIKIQWEHTGLNILGQIVTRWFTTDKSGRFVLELGKADIEPHIYEIKCDGYDFRVENNTYFVRDQTGPNNPLLATSKANPVVFKLRKQGETAFLVRENDVWFQIRQNESGQSRGYDAIRGVKVRDLKKLVLNDEPLVSDMLVKAICNTNDMSWTVSLSPGNTNGGIIVSEQLLYEAPDTGYQSEYTFTPEDRKPVKAKYVYLKSREPAIYSRVEIEHVNASKEFFRLSGKAVTNPYGDRNLEQATDLPYEVTKQLTDEAKTSFRQNKRPSRPDLPKLVKETKEKADKSKQKSP